MAHSWQAFSVLQWHSLQYLQKNSLVHTLPILTGSFIQAPTKKGVFARMAVGERRMVRKRLKRNAVGFVNARIPLPPHLFEGCRLRN
jgi:hypothetical protein